MPKLDPEELKDRWRLGREFWEPHHARFKSNMLMYAPTYYDEGGSSQWPAKTREMRDKRPMLSFSMLGQPIQQIVNDARQNRLGPRIVPVDGRMDTDMAQVIEDYIRAVDYHNRAAVADEYALEMAAAGGFGIVRLSEDYADDTSFEKRLIINRVLDPTKVILDPFMTEADGSDMEWAGGIESYSRKAFRRLFPDADKNDPGFSLESDDEFVDEDENSSVQVLEYFAKEYGKPETIWLLSNGQVVRGDKEKAQLTAEQTGESIVADREVRSSKVWQYCTNGREDLREPAEWPDSRCVPFIPVWGKEIWSDGKRQFRAVIEDSKDGQQGLNYLATKAVELIGLSPLAPREVDPEAIAGWEDKWASAHIKNFGYLPKRTYDKDGRPFAPTQREQFEPPIQGYALMVEQFKSFLDATHGIQRVSRGETDPSVKSGRMTLALQRQSDMSAFHIHDNLARAVEQRYRIMVRVLSRHLAEGSMSHGRLIRIVGEDNTERTVAVLKQMTESGEQVGFSLKEGEKSMFVPFDPEMFDVRVHTGPSLSTRRQEASLGWMELSAKIPAVAQAAPDIVVANTDLPGAEDVAERIRGMMGIDSEEMPPQAKAQLAQMQQQLQAAGQYIQQLEAEKAGKVVDNQFKLQTAQLKAQADAAMQGQKLASEEQQTIYANDIKLLIAQIGELAEGQRTQAKLIADLTKSREALAQPGPVS